MEITIPGNPRPKSRPRFGNGRTFTPKEDIQAEREIAAHITQHIEEPIDGPVSIEIDFFRDSARRVDLDNLVKRVLDAANGVAYFDDNQVVEIRATKNIDKEDPRTVINVALASSYRYGES
ncbi:MAG: RusA family crossover junction endodeoxyribonuclease [Gammaproteobacteria bacterium]|nr:RusA family crossover junction endodeoxyribonuclease [Gammaproteobacteria bacterium]